jgi:hypothetical protein
VVVEAAGLWAEQRAEEQEPALVEQEATLGRRGAVQAGVMLLRHLEIGMAKQMATLLLLHLEIGMAKQMATLLLRHLEIGMAKQMATLLLRHLEIGMAVLKESH